jgi:5-epi-alpha-selinene synthase
MHAPIQLVPSIRDCPPKKVLDFDPMDPRRARPLLDCSLVPAINEHVTAAHAHTERWVVQRGLVHPDDRTFDGWAAARFAWLGARAYPTVSREQLELISDWLSFLFFYDDMCDTHEIGEPDYRAELGILEDRLVCIAAGSQPHAADAPLTLALQDICDRLARHLAPAWLDRFAHHLQEYIEGVRWERALRLDGGIPNIGTYSRLRLLNSAVFPCLDIAGMFIDPTDPSFVEGVYVQQLEVMANDYISWVNDIYGIDKEIREQTTANLVVVLRNQDALAWPDAVDSAIDRCNAEHEAFCSLRELVLEHTDARVHAYVHALESWMRGNLDWYAETRRYRS